MPNIPAMYDGSSSAASAAGGGTPPATPGVVASNPPAGNGSATTSTPPAPAPTPGLDTSADTLTIPERAIKAENWSTKLYHGVLNALGGGGDVAYARDPQTGKMVATPTATGPGTQWKKIIAGAVTGFGAAAAAGSTGPGATMRMAGAGVQAGANLARERDDRARMNANEDFAATQKTKMQDAQLALLSHQIAASTFDLGRAQVEASVADSQRESNFEQVIADGGNGSTDMGVFPDFQSVIRAFKEAPELHDHQAGGRIITIPHINGKGQVDGVHAALVTPDWLTAKINRELPITVRSFKDGKTQESTFTIPAGSLTGAQFSQMLMAQSRDAVEEWTKTTQAKAQASEADSRAKLVPSEEAKNYAAAAHDRAESMALNNATDDATIQSNAQQLVEGTADPSNLSKRSKSYDRTLAMANAYSMAKYGKPFDLAKAAGDYKFATNVQTYNTLNFLNSLTGRDNQSGNLGEVIRLSDGLKRSEFPPLNKVELWTKLAAGHPEVTAYRTALLETADQAAKILQGGGTGSQTSDKKIEQTLEILNASFNREQMKSAASELRTLLANRKTGIIGDNRYLLQWHGVQQPGGGPPATGSQPASAPPASLLKEGFNTKFGNGQTWTLKNGVPTQVGAQ